EHPNLHRCRPAGPRAGGGGAAAADRPRRGPAGDDAGGAGPELRQHRPAADGERARGDDASLLGGHGLHADLHHDDPAIRQALRPPWPAVAGM
ncbi:MAG: hypothetical protein AVDCRST_MAG27-537, partial [uncultured Craurococcus sp.]